MCSYFFLYHWSLDSDYFFLLIIFHCSGLGHGDSEYIDISGSSVRNQLRLAFILSGFANQSVGDDKLLPCSLGWFVNASSEVNKCIECPAGKLLLSLTDYTSLNRGNNILICL